MVCGDYRGVVGSLFGIVEQLYFVHESMLEALAASGSCLQIVVRCPFEQALGHNRNLAFQATPPY